MKASCRWETVKVIKKGTARLGKYAETEAEDGKRYTASALTLPQDAEVSIGDKLRVFISFGRVEIVRIPAA